MSINNLYSQKWQKFLKRVWPFKFIPFVELVLAAGSLATGNACPPHNLRQKEPVQGTAQVMWGMHENSDFDVIVGVRQGRIFTARAFCILAFGMLGWRAKHPNSLKSLPLQYTVLLKWKHPSKDKLCFNHFVTPAAYRLSPPHNEYWKNLYKNLVPVYGEPVVIQKFFDANADWLQERRRYKSDQRHVYKKKRLVARIREWLLKGKFGDWLEKILKAIQITRIENSLKNQSGYKPRIIYSDNELEFHPHTQRIEQYLEKLKNGNF